MGVAEDLQQLIVYSKRSREHHPFRTFHIGTCLGTHDIRSYHCNCASIRLQNVCDWVPEWLDINRHSTAFIHDTAYTQYHTIACTDHRSRLAWIVVEAEDGYACYANGRWRFASVECTQGTAWRNSQHHSSPAETRSAAVWPMLVCVVEERPDCAICRRVSGFGGTRDCHVHPSVGWRYVVSPCVCANCMV